MQTNEQPVAEAPKSKFLATGLTDIHSIYYPRVEKPGAQSPVQ